MYITLIIGQVQTTGKSAVLAFDPAWDWPSTLHVGQITGIGWGQRMLAYGAKFGVFETSF